MIVPPHCKMDLYFGGGGGGGEGIQSIVDSIKTLKTSTLKSGVTLCWLVQVCFSSKFGKFSSTSPMPLHV